jgi:hypothetical protein
MNDPPGTMPKPARTHPRRPPAHKSVSLRHSPQASGSKSRAQQASTLSSPTLASDKANPPSSVSPQLFSNKHSSGESSDAGQWFEKTNNDASQSKDSFVDSEYRIQYPTQEQLLTTISQMNHPFSCATPLRPRRHLTTITIRTHIQRSCIALTYNSVLTGAARKTSEV